MHNHILETQEITALRLKATFGYHFKASGHFARFRFKGFTLVFKQKECYSNATIFGVCCCTFFIELDKCLLKRL